MGEWHTGKIGDLVEIKHGYAFKGENFTDSPTGDLLLTPGNFAIGGGFQWSKAKYYSGEVPEGFVLNPGDILVTMTDLSKNADTLGYSARVPATKDRLLHNQRLGKVVVHSDAVLPSFVHWILRTQDYRNEILASYTGSTVKHTSPAKIKAYQFPIPSLDEQESICSLLDALERKIHLNGEMNKTLEAMARALFKDWFVDFGPVHAKMGGREPYLSQDIWNLFPDRLDEEGKPPGWEEKPLSSFLNIIGGGTPKTSVEEYWGGGIPWFSVVDTPPKGSAFVVNTQSNITKKGLNESSARLVPEGTTIISARGTVGNLAIAGKEMAFNQSCYGLRGKDEVGDCFVYLAAEIMVDRLKQMAHGSVFSTITRSTFDGVYFAMPDPRTMEVFEETVDPLFARIQANVKENGALAATRDLLLPKLMSGEIRVKEVEREIEEAV